MPRQVIVVKTGESGIGDKHEELIAAGAITPGHMLQLDTAGKVVVHAGAGLRADLYFAKEDPLRGNDITTPYASGDPVQVHKGTRQDQINAILTTSQTIVIGDELMSTGDGTLSKKTSTNVVVAKAREAVTTTGAVARLLVELV